MAAKKRTAKTSGRKRKSIPATDRTIPILSTAAGSFLYMTAVVVTSGSVLLFLVAAKRFL
jgi:hypothetical protein